MLHGCSTFTPRWSSVDLSGSVRRSARSQRVRAVRRASSWRSIAAAWSLILVSRRTSEHRCWRAPTVEGDGAAARGPTRDTRPRLPESISFSMTLDEAEHHGRGRRSRSRTHLVTLAPIPCHAEVRGRHAQDLCRHRRSRQITPLSQRQAQRSQLRLYQSQTLGLPSPTQCHALPRTRLHASTPSPSITLAPIVERGGPPGLTPPSHRRCREHEPPRPTLPPLLGRVTLGEIKGP